MPALATRWIVQLDWISRAEKLGRFCRTSWSRPSSWRPASAPGRHWGSWGSVAVRRSAPAPLRHRAWRPGPLPATELRSAGFACADLHAVGYTATDLNLAGFSPSELKAVGIPVTELRIAGLRAEQLEDVGFDCRQQFTPIFLFSLAMQHCTQSLSIQFY